MQPEQKPGEYITTEDVAKILNVSPSYLNKARVSGDGPPFSKFGHAVRYYVPAVLEWAANRSHRSTSEYEAA